MTTDTHKKPAIGDVGREAFEQAFPWLNVDRSAVSPDLYESVTAHDMYEGWKAALRYRDELEKGDV